MSEEEQDNLESENQEQEAGDSEEQEETSSEEKDYSSLYENQKKRAEKAEKEAKELKEKVRQLGQDDEQESSDDSQQSEEQLEVSQQGSTADIRTEARMAAQYSDDEIEKAKKIASVEGMSLSQAANSDLFKAWKQQNDQQQRSEQADVGASKGSGYQKQKADIGQPGISDEEHERLWRQRMGR